jgi:hypothetical protein
MRDIRPQRSVDFKSRPRAGSLGRVFGGIGLETSGWKPPERVLDSEYASQNTNQRVLTSRVHKSKQHWAEPVAPLQLRHQFAWYLSVARPNCNTGPMPVPAAPSARPPQVRALEAQPPIVTITVPRRQAIDQPFGIVETQALVCEERQPPRNGVDLSSVDGRPARPRRAVGVIGRRCPVIIRPIRIAGGRLRRSPPFFPERLTNRGYRNYGNPFCSLRSVLFGP